MRIGNNINFITTIDKNVTTVAMYPVKTDVMQLAKKFLPSAEITIPLETYTAAMQGQLATFDVPVEVAEAMIITATIDQINGSFTMHYTGETDGISQFMYEIIGQGTFILEVAPDGLAMLKIRLNAISNFENDAGYATEEYVNDAITVHLVDLQPIETIE